MDKSNNSTFWNVIKKTGLVLAVLAPLVGIAVGVLEAKTYLYPTASTSMAATTTTLELKACPDSFVFNLKIRR